MSDMLLRGSAPLNARHALGLPQDATVVGTVGRVDYQKAPEHLVEAAARMRRQDTVFVWIGSGPELARMESLTRARGLTHRFHWVGERRDVAALLPALDLFVMSSRYEGLPCAVVEAMRCGLPVVATAVNSVPDLVIPGDSGLLVPPARPRELAAAIDGLLDDPNSADRLARRGQQLAGRPFDASLLAETLHDVYTGALTARALSLAG